MSTRNLAWLSGAFLFSLFLALIAHSIDLR